MHPDSIPQPSVSRFDDSDRSCTSCGRNVETATAPHRVECDGTVNTTEPRCAACCDAHGSVPCDGNCSEFVARVLALGELTMPHRLERIYGRVAS